MSKDRETILFFDGVCNLCNKAVDFFIKRDTNLNIKYAPLQGETAKDKLSSCDYNDLDSVVLFIDGKVYRKSKAIIRALGSLGGTYRLVKIFLIIPTEISDMLYDFIAKRRYEFFGKEETCRLPNKDEKQQFLK